MKIFVEFRSDFKRRHRFALWVAAILTAGGEALQNWACGQVISVRVVSKPDA